MGPDREEHVTAVIADKYCDHCAYWYQNKGRRQWAASPSTRVQCIFPHVSCLIPHVSAAPLYASSPSIRRTWSPTWHARILNAGSPPTSQIGFLNPTSPPLSHSTFKSNHVPLSSETSNTVHWQDDQPHCIFFTPVPLLSSHYTRHGLLHPAHTPTSRPIPFPRTSHKCIIILKHGLISAGSAKAMFYPPEDRLII